MSWIKNFLLLSISLFLAIFAAELMLRVFVGDPAYLAAGNRVLDQNFGFKVKSDLDGIDAYGFRNLPGKSNDYELAAIGDSHTYGVGVKGIESWPYQLEKSRDINVYNMGISRNGIYSYHYLVKSTLQKSKKVIVGLYLPNDFQSKGSACHIDFLNGFWSEEVKRLKLNPPMCRFSTRVSPEQQSEWTVKSFLKASIAKSSFLTLVDIQLFRPVVSTMSVKSLGKLTIHPRFAPIKYERLKATFTRTNISSSSVQIRVSDFEKMLRDWVAIASQGQLGFVLIPSRQAVYRTAINVLNDMELVSNLNVIDKFTHNELVLEKLLIEKIMSLGIPVRSSRMEVVDAFISELPAKGTESFYPDSGHPNVLGHSAYASSASKVFSEMERYRKN